jgi:hypothetical protein
MRIFNESIELIAETESGEGRQDLSPSGIRRSLEAKRTAEKKLKEKKKKRKASKRYRDYQERVQAYKEDRQKWLEKQAAENTRRREEAAAVAKSTGGGEVISSKDTGATATAKGISNVASVAGRLLGVGVRAAGKRMREKDAARQVGQKKAGEKAAETTAAMGQKLLPPGRSGPEKTDKTRLQQPGTSRLPEPTPRPFTTGQRVRTSKRLLPLGVNRASESPISKRPSSGLFNPNAPKVDTTPRPESLGQKARRNTKLRNKLITARMEEYEYSCWREEFLYELGELRQKAKKRNDEDPVIDIMTGENKITLNPNITEATKILKEQAKIKILKYAASQYPKMNEEMNSASHMAKATPRITGHDKSSSDKNKLKQPGKYSAEFVRDEMRKMFAGSRNYKLNSNLANVDADDNDVPKWTQDASTNSTSASSNESFDGHRHHSSGETTDVSNSSTEASARKRRATSAVLKAMAAMNKDVEPKAKKKKKKKSEQ